MRNFTRQRDVIGLPNTTKFAAHSRMEASDMNDHTDDTVERHHRPGLIDLTDPTTRILEAITEAGGQPYLVGGCVRDALLGGHVSKDVDIEVFGLTMKEIDAALSTKVGYVDEFGANFSVLKMTVGGEDFDISVPRKDVKTGDGHRGFDIEPDPFSSLTDATGRRDFTINALMFDPATEEVIDCWGGMGDLDDKVLRHTTDAFGEDPLRVLRGVQFAARFGFTMHSDTAGVARGLADQYTQLPTERVWTEWHKIATKGTHISHALGVLADTGWEKHYPGLSVLHDVPQDPTWHPEGNVHVHSGMAADKAASLADEAGLDEHERAVVVFGALVHDFGKATHTQHVTNPDGTVTIKSHGHDEAGVKPAGEFLNSIGAPSAVIKKVLPIVEAHMCISSTGQNPSRPAVRRLSRRLSPATMNEWAMVCEADKGGRGSASGPAGTEKWLSQYEVEVETNSMTPLLRGDHLIAAGMKPGPTFRPILDAALAAQDEGLFDDESGALVWFQNNR